MEQDDMLALATRYLRDNEALRAAVGAAADAQLTPRYLGVGEHNLNFRFEEPRSGRRFVLRINVAKQPFHEDQVGYEFAALRALEASGRVPQAVYLDNNAEAPCQGALVIGFCEGDMLDFDHLRPGDLRCAAQIMADVHAVQPPQDCSLFHPADPLRELFDECVARFEVYRASAFEDARITRWVERFIKAAGEASRPTRRRPCGQARIVNTETLPSHFLIPAACAAEAARATRDGQGRFCDDPGSFVDWERPIIGEVAQDLAYFTSPTTTYWDSEYLFPAREVQSFLDDYWRAVDGRFAPEDFEERFRAFRMMTALRSATWCCKALLVYGHGGSGHTTDKTARKLPVYLSDDFMQLVADECFG